MKKLTSNEFINKATKIHGDRYDYSHVDYIGALAKVTIFCKKHGKFNQKAGDHLFGYGCPKCNNMFMDTEKFIIKANLVHHGQYDYSLSNYVNAKTKIKIICKIHGVFLQWTHDHLRGNGCPHCKKSNGENIIANHLTNINVNFEREKKFEECRGIKRTLPFDFYLPKHNILIEYDGEHHFNAINYWGGEEKFRKQIETDRIKNNFALNHNIRLLRIKHSDLKNINEIINNVI